MFHELINAKIAIIGAGNFCVEFLKFIYGEHHLEKVPEILGIADIVPTAPGIQYAKNLGLHTTTDHTQLFSIDGLEIILEMTDAPELGEKIRQAVSPGIKVIDHFQARSMWDMLRAENIRNKYRKELSRAGNDPKMVKERFEALAATLIDLLKQRNRRAYEIEIQRVEKEKALSQIIQGSTIPTFVIDGNHRVTHWNRSMELLTGLSAEEIVGTEGQWRPFYEKQRPTMADVILDQLDESEMEKLYGSRWRRSALIENAYEAESFFPHQGENGRWLWYTAAPIKSPEGKIVGAIETLWDKTEDKWAEEEREYRNRELVALCSIYTALNASVPFSERIREAVKEIRSFLEADSICIFLLENDRELRLHYSVGMSGELCNEQRVPRSHSTVHRIILNNEVAIFEELPDEDNEEMGLLISEGMVSLAYIPISAKGKNALGIIRMASRRKSHFNDESKNVLELIGNRIGVAVENALLQEQYIKSEEKYRSLFNNDPNPIFLIGNENFEILDINQRALDHYGYNRAELFCYPFVGLGDDEDEEVALGLSRLDIGQSLLFSKKRHYRKDGKPFFVNINVSRAQHTEGDVLIATTTDITENLEKETQLIQASKMTTLGQMAAGIAHEINQPLNVIQVCADYIQKMLKKGVPMGDEDLKELADDIGNNIQRAANIIQHMRDFARQSEIDCNKISVNRPIQDVFQVLGHQLKAHQIKLGLELDPDLPEIMADHNRLEQVFINLVTNALDAIEEKCEKEAPEETEKSLNIRSFFEEGRVWVTVTDSGNGMSDEVKQKIFEPFFTTKKVGKGTGLGVSISYGIIRDYNGTIHIDSEIGKGTTFKLSFPVADNTTGICHDQTTPN